MRENRVTLGSLNLKVTLGHDELKRDLMAFISKADPDIFGLQEFEREQRVKVLELSNFDSFDYYREHKGRRQGGNPIVWRAGLFELLDSYIKNVQGNNTWWRPNGAAVEETWASVVKLKHLPTGRIINVLNVHTAPGIQRRGKPSKLRNRVRAAVACFKSINRWAKSIPNKEAVVIMGDFNWDAAFDKWRYSPERIFRATMISQFQRHGLSKHGTIGNYGRDIDYIFIRRNCSYHKAIKTMVVRNLRSDHNGVAWETELRG